MAYDISEQIKIWEDRTYYPGLKFKEENSIPGSSYYEIIKRFSRPMLEGKFKIISTEYESQVYKIPRLMIEKFGYLNSDFAFIEGAMLESYIRNEDGKILNWKLQERAEEFISHYKKEIKGKVVLIQSLSINISPEVALYIAHKFEEAGARGLITSKEKNSGQNLEFGLAIQYYKNLIQFPMQRVVETKREIIDDGN